MIPQGLRYPLRNQKQTSLLTGLILGNYAMILSAQVARRWNPQPDNLCATFLRSGKEIVPLHAMQFLLNIRSFTGREKYKRPMWITSGLENPTVTVQEMVMLSTSVLRIQWTVKGKPKSLLAAISGDLIIKVKSEFTLNQISGQVIEHEESWDLSSSSPIAQAYFWTSRRLFAASESAKDLADVTKDLTANLTTRKEDTDIYRDPTDPNKFFQRDDSFERDGYQIALFLAIVYFVVQFLKNTL
ncbi:hypothetical protein CARUB_v10020744mg [Capsella rubella]|uniref:AT1G65230-like protein n=1 Tax=Capsella rubella TaxID=81985 RepID=R0IFL0_9BRAS|nr:hypothetical protein CARUB_v10020744mg [Capsella rubella]